MEQSCTDGSSETKEMKIEKVNGEERFVKKGNKYGVYYLIDWQGNLGTYDELGYIGTAKKIK